MNESLDSRQLRAFVTLAKTGSCTLSASELCVTHSAVSHSIRALEEQVGCRLFSKQGKKMMLTEAGEALLHHAGRVLSEMRQARRTLAELSRWGSRRLRLAAEPIFVPAFLTPVLLKFHQEFPNCRLQIEGGGDSGSAGVIESDRVDLALTEKPPAEIQLEFIPLFADRCVFVVNSAHPLAERTSVPRTEWGKYPCLLVRHSDDARRQLEEFLSVRGIALNIVGEIENADLAKNLVKQSAVMSLLPRWLATPELKNRTLVGVPLGGRPFEKTWGIAHSKGRPLNPTESAFLKFCRRRVAELA